MNHPITSFNNNGIFFVKDVGLLISFMKKNNGFNQIKRAENQMNLNTAFFFCDCNTNPSSVISLGKYSGLFYCYSNDQKKLFNFIKLINWNKGILFPFKRYLNEIDINLKPVIYHSKEEVDYIYFSELDKNFADIVYNGMKIGSKMEPEISTVYYGCNFDENISNFREYFSENDNNFIYLTKNHYDMIVSDWWYETPFSRDELEWAFTNNLAIGYQIDNKVVSWMLLKPEGQTAILYTLQEYRKKGISLKVFSKLLDEIKKKYPYFQFHPISFLDDTNTPSIHIHTKLGFKITTPVISLRSTTKKEKYKKLLRYESDVFFKFSDVKLK